MKNGIFLLLLFCLIQSNAQDFPFWGKLKIGKYAVGFKDTVLYNQSELYDYFGYQGQKPYFINIWYPAKNNPKLPYMKFSDYMGSAPTEKLAPVKDSLRRKYENIYIRDAIAKRIRNMKPTDTTYSEVLRKLFTDVKNATVNSKRNLSQAKGIFPCIYYHHGAQSTMFDNVTFCEYMASNGYVVISSNYLWPVANQNSLGHSKKLLADIEFVITGTKPLIDKNTPYLIAAGHSLGAQAILMFDTLEQKPFKQIIAFHTTLEDITVQVAKKYHPQLMRALQKDSLMTTPTVVIAPEFRIKDGFDFLTFRENKITPYTFVTVKTKYITHDGLITLGNLRAPFAKKYKLDDYKELALQQGVYEQTLTLTKLLIEKSVEKAEQLDSELQKVFHVRAVNR